MNDSTKKKRKTKEPSLEAQLENTIATHEERYARWSTIYNSGTNDPNCKDGVNLNLVRSQICSCKKRIEDLSQKLSVPVPECYNREVPIKVDYDYMATPELIVENAQKALADFYALPAYQELVSYEPLLTPETRKAARYDSGMGYVKRLVTAIQYGNLVQMRLFSRVDLYADCITSCLERVKKILGDVVPPTATNPGHNVELADDSINSAPALTIGEQLSFLDLLSA